MTADSAVPSTGACDLHDEPLQTASISPISLLTLRFAQDSLEKSYSSSWSQKQVGLDWVGCFVSQIQLFLGIAYIVAKRMHVPSNGMVLLVGSAVLHGLHTALLRSRRDM
jgi:hypothetical protein